MRCPSCGMITNNNTYCDNCNTNLVLYNKVHMMAIKLYNQGLEQAQGRYLSGAIETLSICIRIKKHYTDARNLLGLIYWEIGEIGQAIKQWVISSSYQKEDNIANDYLSYIQKNPSQLEQYKDTINLYNTALEYIKQGSDDMGVISLKRAISQNPTYIEAKCLLAFCYITSGQEDKATEIIKEVLKQDKDNPKAIRYLTNISPNVLAYKKETMQNRKTQTKISKPLSAKGAESMIRPKSLKGTIVAFVLGAICMLGVYGILIAPSKTANLEEQIKQIKNSEMELQSRLQQITDEKEESIQKLEQENKKLIETNEILKKEQEIQVQVQEFQRAQDLYKSREWVEAAELLYKLNKDYLDQDAKSQYDTLIKEVYPRAGEQLYRSGYNQYQRKNYTEAQELLEKSYIYEKDQYFSDNALYIIGRCYEAQGDIERAKQYYESVIEKYPGSDSAYNAKSKLN